MTTKDLVKYVTDFLTGGGLIPLNVKETVVESFVKDGLERVTPYYKETAVLETVDVTQATGGIGTSGYVELSKFSHTVHIVEMVVPTESPYSGLSVMQEMAGLLGLERSVVMDNLAVDYAQWRQLRRDLVKSVGRRMTFRLVRSATEKRLYIDDAKPSMRVSVLYAPLPEDLSEITYAPAINWIKDWTIALTEIAQSRVTGMFKTDTLGFAMNSDEVGSSGSSEKARLLAELPNLHHSYGSLSRG